MRSGQRLLELAVEQVLVLHEVRCLYWVHPQHSKPIGVHAGELYRFPSQVILYKSSGRGCIYS